MLNAHIPESSADDLPTGINSTSNGLSQPNKRPKEEIYPSKSESIIKSFFSGVLLSQNNNTEVAPPHDDARQDPLNPQPNNIRVLSLKNQDLISELKVRLLVLGKKANTYKIGAISSVIMCILINIFLMKGDLFRQDQHQFQILLRQTQNLIELNRPIDQILNALEEAEKESQSLEINKYNANLFLDFFKMKGNLTIPHDLPVAAKCYEEALNIAKEYFPENFREIIFIQTNLTDIYSNQGKFLQAEKCLNKSMELRKEKRFDISRGSMHSGEFYMKWQKREMAEKYLTNSIAYHRELPEEDQIENLARFFRNKGKILKNEDTTEAKNNYREAVTTLKSSKQPNEKLIEEIKEEYFQLFNERFDIEISSFWNNWFMFWIKRK